MPVLKRGLTLNPQSFVLNAIGVDGFNVVASVGANVANTAIQAYWIAPCNFKINKVAIFASAIAAITGTHSFNIVVGTTGAYTQGSVATNDNSIAGASVAYGTTYPSAATGVGYPTNIAVAGNALFSADVPFQATTTTTASSPGLAMPLPFVAGGAAGGTGQGWIALATGGLYGLIVPTNYDAVYPAGTPLTLRVTTPASTGSITNLLVNFNVELVGLRGAPISTSGQVIAYPGLDF